MIADVLIARSVRDEATGCLRWTGAHAPKGYGQIRSGGRVRAVHRLAHEFWVGPIPAGYEVDHVITNGCRHRDCIEPSHLEAVTHAENVARQLALITHCPSGHAYSPENTYVHKNERGYFTRSCRACKNANQRRRRRG